MIHMNFVQITETDWLPLQQKGKFSQKIFSEIIRGMKLKLCIHVHDISLNKTLFFIAVAQALWLL